jgi:guanylate kinase
MGARPLLIVVSAPSGAGKTTLCDMLLADRSDIVYSISCTTRDPRPSEVEGEDYYFLSEEEFDKRLKAESFLEHATVHGHRYGTLREVVLEALGEGQSVLMDIDVAGAEQIRAVARKAPEDDPIRQGFLDVFIMPPSLAVLRQRLEWRGEDRPEVIEARLQEAANEMAHASEFQYAVVNDDLEQAFRRLRDIVDSR